MDWNDEVAQTTTAMGTPWFPTRITDVQVADRIRFGDVSKDEHEELMRRYPRGAEVTVRYRPETPEVSVLEPGLFPELVTLLLFTVLVCAVAAPIATVLAVVRAKAWSARRQFLVPFCAKSPE